MPELPQAMKARFEQEYGLNAYDAGALTASRAIASYFSDATKAGADSKLAANWIMGSISAKLNEEDSEISASPVSPAQLAGLLKRISDNRSEEHTSELQSLMRITYA